MYVEVRRMNTIPIGIDGILITSRLATSLSRLATYKTNKTKATIVSEHSVRSSQPSVTLQNVAQVVVVGNHLVRFKVAVSIKRVIESWRKPSDPNDLSSW